MITTDLIRRVIESYFNCTQVDPETGQIHMTIPPGDGELRNQLLDATAASAEFQEWAATAIEWLRMNGTTTRASMIILQNAIFMGYRLASLELLEGMHDGDGVSKPDSPSLG